MLGLVRLSMRMSTAHRPLKIQFANVKEFNKLSKSFGSNVINEYIAMNISAGDGV